MSWKNTRPLPCPTNIKCFACDRVITTKPHVADTRDSQIVYVGSECFKHIAAAGEEGYQPPRGGPRLYIAKATGKKG